MRPPRFKRIVELRGQELEEVPMTIVGGFDVHRAQITFDYVDTDTGEVSTGQIRPATRVVLGKWLAQRFDGRADVAFAVEGCTGWRFVVEELLRAGVEPHLAEPADTATARGRKKRAKTDRADARLQRDLLAGGRLPESWIPPAHVLEVRTLGRLYVALMDERRAWQQRIHAQLFHQGVPPVTGLLTVEGRATLRTVELSAAGRQMIDTALAAIDALTAQITPLRRQLQAIGCRQPGPRALLAHYGIGPLCAAIIWAELGDCRRFANSDQAVRFTGLDITVYSSDGKRSPGRLARQGSPELRWALFEAAKAAARAGSPDHDYYTAIRDRLGGKRPALSVARKLVRRCHHTLRELGDRAWLELDQPVEDKAA
jgi:transposase